MARTLYYAPGACSLASHIALEETGADFEARRIDLAANQQLSAEYLAINEKGRVPALVEDGWLLTENAAILRHVARSFPEAGLWPEEARDQARADEWLTWLATSHHIAYAHVRRPERYTDDEAAYPGIAAKGSDTYGDVCTMTEVRLSNGGWALGERYSVVDPYLLVFWLWAQRPGVELDVRNRFPAWTAHGRAPGRADRVRARTSRSAGLRSARVRAESIDDMLMSITTPGLPPFHGAYGLWETALVLPAMAALKQGLGERPVYVPAYFEPEVFETQEVSVCLKAADRWPSEMQFLNCRWLEHSDADLAGAMLAALVQHVPVLRSQYDFLDAADRHRFFPREATAEALRPHIRLKGITILPVHSATPYLGVAFDCAWDDEHGLGLTLYGAEVIEIGGGDVGACEDAARVHREAALAALAAYGPPGPAG